MIIRPENPTDIPAIRSLVTAAFRDAPHSDGNEANIVDALRIGGVLTVSLVAEDEGKIVGHVGFSPVAVNSQEFNWFGLGPVAVLTEKRRCGIGAALIQAGLKCLKELGARGCVVLGDPVYYRRFGFERDIGLRFANVPSEYFQRLVINGEPPQGVVNYHPAFSASGWPLVAPPGSESVAKSGRLSVAHRKLPDIETAWELNADMSRMR